MSMALSLKVWTLLAQLALAGLGVQGRQITIKNSCKGTVYAAYAGQGGTVTGSEPGWEMAQGASTTIDAPETWNNARIWARTGCGAGGTNCIIGKCASNTVTCDGTEFGTTGATLAEFTFGAYETYDVSIVDGFNLPMAITPSGGTAGTCDVASCGTTKDILANCDPILVYPAGSETIWSCQSACGAGIQFSALDSGAFDPNDSPTCCTGSAWANNCPTSNIPFYAPYKAMCEEGYIYAKDDPNGGAHGCIGPSYLVEFCPGGVGAGISPSGVAAKAQATGGAIVGGTVGGGGGSDSANNGDNTSQGAVAPTSTAAVVPTSTSAAAPAVVTSSAPAEVPAASTSTAGRGGGSHGGDDHYTGVEEFVTYTPQTETKTITRDGTVVVQVWVTETARKRAEATTVKRLVTSDEVGED